MQYIKLTCLKKLMVLVSLWKVAKEYGKIDGYDDIEVDEVYVDAAAMFLITKPHRFQVIGHQPFGDILSKGRTSWGLGMVPSANIGDHNDYLSLCMVLLGYCR